MQARRVASPTGADNGRKTGPAAKYRAANTEYDGAEFRGDRSGISWQGADFVAIAFVAGLAQTQKTRTTRAEISWQTLTSCIRRWDKRQSFCSVGDRQKVPPPLLQKHGFESPTGFGIQTCSRRCHLRAWRRPPEREATVRGAL